MSQVPVRIAHISDTHGGIPRIDQLGTIDVVVHSGDMMPSWSRGIRAIEVPRQTAWCAAEADRMANCWGTKQPFLYTSGNHDYVDPTPAMRAAGMNAECIDDRVVEAAGLKFYGFPYVHWFTGEWNREEGEDKLYERLRPVAEMIERGEIDILVAHSPYYGNQDRNGYGERCGSKAMREIIFNLTRPLTAYLCGHIHEAAGVNKFHKMIYSNAATVQRVLSIPR